MAKVLLSINEVTSQDFFITNGLYNPIVVSNSNEITVAILHLPKATQWLYGDYSLDCYCVHCGKDTAFLSIPNRPPFNVSTDEMIGLGMRGLKTYERQFRCPRNSEHILTFTLQLDKGTLTKIGQYPSYADINSQGIEKYKSLLTNDSYIEFKIGIGLFAHGVGAGSLVYLRRIIEKSIINPAYERAKKEEPSWDNDAYGRSRMEGKIKLLAAYLPEYLVKNPVVYSIVSKGIHELGEKECIQYFPVLRDFIELVLIEMKNTRDLETKRAQLAADMQKIAGKI